MPPRTGVKRKREDPPPAAPKERSAARKAEKRRKQEAPKKRSAARKAELSERRRKQGAPIPKKRLTPEWCAHKAVRQSLLKLLASGVTEPAEQLRTVLLLRDRYERKYQPRKESMERALAVIDTFVRCLKGGFVLIQKDAHGGLGLNARRDLNAQETLEMCKTITGVLGGPAANTYRYRDVHKSAFRPSSGTDPLELAGVMALLNTRKAAPAATRFKLHFKNGPHVVSGPRASDGASFKKGEELLMPYKLG